MDGVEKLDKGRRDDGDTDAVGFPALLGVGGDHLEMLADVCGQGLGVQNVEDSRAVFQCDGHGLPFLPVLPVAQQI